jgi:hypothetical protein
LNEKIVVEIKAFEKQLVQRSRRDYPTTQRLQLIAGVGPLSTLGFVLSANREQRVRMEVRSLA